MGLKKLASKVADYKDNLENGKARKIRPEHVRKVLEKLRAKEAELYAAIAGAGEERKLRLQLKLGIAREHIARAEWLLGEID